MEALPPPLSLKPGDVIPFAFRLLGASLRPVAVVSLVWVPVLLFEDRLIPTAPYPITLLINMGFALLHGSLATALILLIGRGRLRGEPMTPPVLLRMTASAWPRLLWTQFLATIAIVLGSIALLLPGIYVAIRLAVVDAVAVYEGRSGPGAMRRSFEMTREREGDIFVLGLAFVGIMVACGAVYLAFVSFFPYAETWPAQAAVHFCYGIAMAFLYFFLLGIYEFLRSREQPEPTKLEPEEGDAGR